MLWQLDGGSRKERCTIHGFLCLEFYVSVYHLPWVHSKDNIGNVMAHKVKVKSCQPWSRAILVWSRVVANVG
jgi:hypothetical protein